MLGRQQLRCCLEKTKNADTDSGSGTIAAPEKPQREDIA
jgi:hypothetical protein